LDVVSAMVTVAFRPQSSATTSYIVEIAVKAAPTDAAVPPTRTCFMWDPCAVRETSSCDQAGWSTRGITTLLIGGSEPDGPVQCEINLSRSEIFEASRIAVFEDLRDNPASSSTTTTTDTTTTTTTTPHGVKVYSNLGDVGGDPTLTNGNGNNGVGNTIGGAADVDTDGDADDADDVDGDDDNSTDEDNSTASVEWSKMVVYSIGALILALAIVFFANKFTQPKHKSRRTFDDPESPPPLGNRRRTRGPLDDDDDDDDAEDAALWKMPRRPSVNDDPFDDNDADGDGDEYPEEKPWLNADVRADMSPQTDTRRGRRLQKIQSNKESKAWQDTPQQPHRQSSKGRASGAWQALGAADAAADARADNLSLASQTVLPPAFGVQRGAPAMGKNVQKRQALRPIAMPKLQSDPRQQAPSMLPLVPVEGGQSRRRGGNRVAPEDDNGEDLFRRQSAELANPDDFAAIPFQIKRSSPMAMAGGSAGTLAPLSQLAPIKARGPAMPLMKPLV